MSKVIDLLERLGKDAHLRHASDNEIEQALLGAGIDPAIRNAILRRDQRELEMLLGASANVCCMIATPAQEERDDEDEDKRQEDDDDGQGDEKAVRLTAG
jgi:hypothetical protein